ncbi:MAG: hypothetical protein A2X36_08240 [Elusimicrobia bacterium GWA2_69_24]|nr:MAG: hypothetical protein A2X36_08240 [Elusimicrobia bacterium GWA2_69_24]HBL18165.1 hypothetical protein [Elusimicrobiota bacterium]
MEITCAACSTALSIPDDRLPKNVPVVYAKCPKCQGKIEIRIPAPKGASSPQAIAPADQPPAETPPPQPEAPAPEPAAPPAAYEAPPAGEEDFVEDRKLAMVCFDQPEAQAEAKAAMESIGFAVHAPAKPEEAVLRLRRTKYEVVILHQEYGGSEAANLVLQTLQPMAMALRRHMCIGLMGKDFRTFDNMMAFAKSVNFVVAERELGKIKAITRQALQDNDQFYRAFREAIRDAGRI